jgi:hypothetical protein
MKGGKQPSLPHSLLLALSRIKRLKLQGVVAGSCQDLEHLVRSAPNLDTLELGISSWKNSPDSFLRYSSSMSKDTHPAIRSFTVNQEYPGPDVSEASFVPTLTLPTTFDFSSLRELSLILDLRYPSQEIIQLIQRAGSTSLEKLSLTMYIHDNLQCKPLLLDLDRMLTASPYSRQISHLVVHIFEPTGTGTEASDTLEMESDSDHIERVVSMDMRSASDHPSRR